MQPNSWSVRGSLVMNSSSDPLEGEDIQTTHWEDARHWMSIYSDLIQFKRGVLDRVRRDVVKLPPPAREAAERDVEIIEIQMVGYQQRLDLWYRRVWDLHGLWFDREARADSLQISHRHDDRPRVSAARIPARPSSPVLQRGSDPQ